MSSEPKQENQEDELVILLHGLFCRAGQMDRLADVFVAKGYDVWNIDYPSTNVSLEEHCNDVHQMLDENHRSYKKVHFVGFSMGGVLARLYLETHPMDNLGRAVFLGSPMKGSPIVNFFKNRRLLKNLASWVHGPAGHQLCFESPQTPTKKVWYEAGTIAGNKGSIPGLSKLFNEKVNDGVVSVCSTRVEGEKDHIVVPADHLSFTDHTSVIEQAVRFIQKGSFDHQKRYKREYYLPNCFRLNKK